MNLYKKFKSLYFSVIIFIFFFVLETSSEKTVTVSVAAGSEECFYETLKADQVIDIDYQVIDGGQGAFDITFYLESPFGRIVVLDVKSPEKSHRIEIEESGDYKLCFDNRFSTFNSKTVFFEIIVEAEDGSDVDFLDTISGIPPSQDEYEMAIQDIEESVKKVRNHLLKIKHLQDDVKNFAIRDKNVLEGNFFKVNSWSILQVLIMISVGLVQVITVKSLFDEEYKMNKIWKKTFR